MGDLFQNDDVLLTASQIREWVREYHAWGEQIEKLEEKRRERQERLALVAQLIGPEMAALLLGSIPTARSGDTPARASRRTRDGSITWTAFIEDYVKSVNRGVEYPELREAISQSVLGPKLAQSDKGFYGAIQKLIDRKALLKRGGFLFGLAAWDEHEKRVKLGIEKEIQETVTRRPAPLEAEVKKFLDTCPNGATGKDVVDHILTVPEFKRSVSRNSTGVYNVLARMVRREQIRKIGQTYYSPDAPPIENSGSQ